ncbi:hypothetical protein KC887_10050 [Candidatus Kaiserbacteria bacterium]|nr:hypothetical protein [Candidatus Kaiserbacteria bacterium]
MDQFEQYLKQVMDVHQQSDGSVRLLKWRQVEILKKFSELKAEVTKERERMEADIEMLGQGN